MDRRTRTATAVLALALVAAGCSGDTDGGGDNRSLTVWTIEDVADRVTAQQKLAEAFTRQTGIKVTVVAVAADQIDQKITSAAGGTRPDVVAALPLLPLRTLESGHLLDTGTAEKVVADLGADTFAPRSLELTRDGDQQLGVPSDGWAQLLVYRRDLFDRLGLDAPTTYDKIQDAARKLTGQNGVAGIALATAPGDAVTEQSFEYLAEANGCELVDQDKNVTLDSPQCVRAFEFYANLAKHYSVKGRQTDDSTRAAYFAGKAAMVVWSSYLLDEMAGLRKDALPTCPECKSVPSFLAQNSGIVTAVQGPDGKQPASFGEVGSWAITKSASKDAAAKFVEYMMSDGYAQWLGIAPEGKLPTRQGSTAGDTSYLQAWQKLTAGVDTRAPLSDYYDPDVLTAVQTSPSTFERWGLPQGQGKLVEAMQGPLPVAKALADLIDGTGSAAGAARSAQQAVEELN